MALDAKTASPQSEEMKELAALCRAGKLFAVQEWLASGRPYYQIGRVRGRTPFKMALDTGFHSLVEVFLQAGMPLDQMNVALRDAVLERLTELARLLVEYGADPRAVTVEDVFDSRSPELIRWMIDLGLDLEERWPIARAFENRQREFLGIYMDVRDKVPSARRQAAMALRVHAKEGNLKWVSLLLWAGADPRLAVPIRDDLDPGSETADDAATAVYDAVVHGQAEVVRKFKVDPSQDNVTDLLCQCWLMPNPDVIQLLLRHGGDPTARVGERTPMEATIDALSFSLDLTFAFSSWNGSRREKALATIEILAAAGARWSPVDSRLISSFRRALGRAERFDAIRSLKRIVAAQAVEREVFRDLMRTPKMRNLLQDGFIGDTAALKRYAGLTEKPKRSRAGKMRLRTEMLS